MEATNRATVVSTNIDEQNNQVIWTVEVENGDQYPMVWNIDDFGHSWGIKAKVPLSQIREFCDKMIGRPFNLVRKGIPDENKDIRKQ